MSPHPMTKRASQALPPRRHSRIADWLHHFGAASVLLTAAVVAPTSRAGWTLPVDKSLASTLVDPWENYYGIHYLQADSFEPDWFDTPVFRSVRDYALPGLPRVKTDDGSVYDETRMSRFISGDPLVGPFNGGPVYAALEDVANGAGVSFLDTMPVIIENDLTVVYTAESFFPIESTSSVDKDYIYWTLRQTYEAFPEAVDKVIWQWGNEINAPGDIFSPTQENDPAGVPFYVDNYLSPAIEAVQRVEADLIANGTFAPGTHIPIATGSFANVSGASNRAWMAEVLEYNITEKNVSSDTLIGKQVWELVDILTGHYPGPAITFDSLKSDWLDTGKVNSVWITEDHGARGEGPADLVSRAMRYIDWAVDAGVDADESRIFWWSTTDTTDPGGQGIEAVDVLGSLFSGKTLHETKILIDGVEAFVMLATDETGEGSLTLVAIPEGYPRVDIVPIMPGDITFVLPDGVTLASVGGAETHQFSIEEPTEIWNLPVGWNVGGSAVTFNLLDNAGDAFHAIDGTLLVTIPIQLQAVPEPSTLACAVMLVSSAFTGRRARSTPASACESASRPYRLGSRHAAKCRR